VDGEKIWRRAAAASVRWSKKRLIRKKEGKWALPTGAHMGVRRLIEDD
jgi:hypothetical protein